MNHIEELMEPAKKLTELNKAQIEKAVEDRQLAVKEYVEMTGTQLKAAAEVKDVFSFNTFIADQWSCAQDSIEKVMSSNKALLENLKVYNEECIKIWREGASVMNKEVDGTVKRVTKKAA